MPSQAEADMADTSQPGHWSYIAACWLLAPALLMSHTSPRCSTALWCSATIPPDLVKIRTPKLQLECFGDNEWDLNQFPSREFEYFGKASKLKQLSVGGWWQVEGRYGQGMAPCGCIPR